MPKYVFEQSITLPAGDELTLDGLNQINAFLGNQLIIAAKACGKTRGRIATEAPFEHVVGDWLPPDDNGIVKPKPGSRPIDYEPREFDYFDSEAADNA